MIFYFNANGNSIGMSPERVYQGSNKANKVYVVCPIPKSAVVSVTYDLPNGDKSASFIMNSVMLENCKEMVDKHGITFNMWEVDLQEIASAYCGCVGVQFTFSLSSGEVVNTSYQRFYVERGVNAGEPEKTDTYAEVLTFLSSINARLLEVENISSENESILTPLKEDVDNLKSVSLAQGQTITENTNAIRSVQSSMNSTNMSILKNANDIKGLDKELEFISSVVNDTIIGKAEISDKFTERKTANGLKVINGTASQVVKIYGDTVEEEDGNFQDAVFYGIESLSANLFNLDNANAIEEESFKVTKVVEDGAISVNGVTTQNQTVMVISTGMPAGGNYSIKFEYLGGTATDLLGNLVETPINIFLIDGSYDYCLAANKGTPFATGRVGSEGKNVLMTIVVNNAMDIVFNDYKFRAMVVEGSYNSSNMPRYTPYIEPSTFALSESVSLGKYDYIDVEKGEIIRQTGYVVKETPLTEEEISLYPNGKISSDGKKLFYMLESPTTISFNCPKEYVVYNGGREKLFIAENESFGNSIVTIRQKYLIKLGV